MSEHKYIITRSQVFIFPSLVEHADMLQISDPYIKKEHVVGAGFVQMYDDTISCYGDSFSLGVISRGAEDVAAIKRCLSGY